MSDTTSEDRGMHVGIWSDGAGCTLFEPFPGADRFWRVSVPIGWSLEVDPYYPPEYEPASPCGIVLRNTYGKDANANEVRLRATHGEWGFRVVSTWPKEGGKRDG